ncbi:tRNA (guanine-N(7)-)-methyltransferase [Thiohalobacter sp. COW1]|uniref:tRNA (guanine-N(7)-)-methyltransferase n=1 Tax=Thiohalobacter thiocyanaticus TaxID=585455 RepID=A0A1Z4VN71_9GAMM|nr:MULTISPECIES: tRNA (guanosine(46)-N7)-methyltransferase TrmB [Thiohalobacter]BAZ92955.1 tRNA (guanine-N(7)-)-methyltransferase [Thiohalobacter thiocyanaticus]BCO32085.1 tRNA (guanine-N(7)-)-methyltransferase [Thiohalobacter sp. COW1]
MTTTDHLRRIRSFVRREGRLTPSQQRALDELLPRYGLAPDAPLDLDAVFGRAAPRTLEIGFGNGDSLATMAAAAPEQDFIGIEVHRPGVGHLLRLIAERELTNIRVVCADAVEVLRAAIPEAGLNRVLLFFPDPWPKKKHHKRRILQPEFVALVARKLAPGGIFHLATDWEDYAGQMLEVMEASPDFTNPAGPGRFAERPADRPLTKFEQRGQRLGHGVWDLLYRRVHAPAP